MSKKKSSKVRSGKTTAGSNLFQFSAAVMIVLLGAFFIYSSFFKGSANNKKDLPVKDYSTILFKKQGELTFTDSAGSFVSQIDIEIAEDDDSRTQGLMYRYEMKENRGMLFIFPVERLQSFWMSRTVMSLDIIFVNKQNEIVKIHRNAIPYDESAYPSNAPAIYVVEVNAGYTEAYNINEGDKIVWRRTN